MFYILEEEGIINDGVRGIFALINNGIYYLIAITFNLIEDLSKISLLSYSNMKDFAQRIYMLLGLFMLFKVSFSIISYIVDPNKMSDRNTGFTGIIKNTIITLILILIVPTCFSLLYEVQDAILSENIIPKLILGSDREISDTSDDNLKIYMSPKYCGDQAIWAKDTGHYIALLVFRPFFQPNPDLGSEEFSERGNDPALRYCFPKYNKYSKEAPSAGWDWTYTIPLVGAYNAISDLFATVNYYSEHSTEDVLNTHDITVGSYLGYEGLYNSANGTDGPFQYSDYDIDFNYLVMMIVGIAVEVILIGISFDVAVRSVKLTFLQLLSPIPIVSYIDPKSGKDGMFKRWYQEVFRTWGSLFIKLIAVFFGVYLIQQLNGKLYLVSGTSSDIKSDYFWIMLFLLIGILMFMKQLPSLIESLIPGMKGAGSFTLNPFKKISNEAMGGKALIGGAAALGVGAVGLAGAGISHAVARNKLKNDIASKEGALKNDRINNLRKQRLNNQAMRANNAKINTLNANRDKVIQDYQKGKIDKDKRDRVLDTLDGKISSLNASNSNIKADNASMRADISKRKEELSDLKNKKLYKNPVSGYAGSFARGGLYGAKAGYKSPSHPLKDAASAVENASKMRNYRDNYSIKDQAIDKLTDIAGIRNESGTTSQTQRDIRKITESLNNVVSNIDNTNRVLAGIRSSMGESNFNMAVNFDSNGRMQYNNAYSGPMAGDISAAISNYNRQLDEKIDLERQIKKLENIKNTSRPGSEK